MGGNATVSGLAAGITMECSMGSTPEAACAPAAGPAASPAATAGLVVFARLPVPGRVKTRLAASVGPEAACRFYKACAEHVMLVAFR